MHLVTKILIVFGALLSVLLAGLTIAYTSNAQAIRDSVGAEKSMSSALNARLMEETQKASQEIAREKAAAAAALDQLQQKNNELARLSNERAKNMADLEEAKLAAARAEATSKGKDERLATLTTMAKALQEENAEARKAQLDMAKRETELMTALNGLESNNQVLAQNVKALQEQLAEQKLGGQKAVKSGGGGSESSMVGSGSGFEMTAGPLVQARVSRLVKADSGEDLAFISAGSSSGLKVGQRLSIVRNGSFLASLILTVVDANESAGRIDRLGRTVDIRTDDLVLSRVN